MGNTLVRNRYWWYRSIYDDYMFREIRATFAFVAVLYLPFYWWGVHINRQFEENNSHINYVTTWGPRRLRLTHSMLFEEFEMDLERFVAVKEAAVVEAPPQEEAEEEQQED